MKSPIRAWYLQLVCCLYLAAISTALEPTCSAEVGKMTGWGPQIVMRDCAVFVGEDEHWVFSVQDDELIIVEPLHGGPTQKRLGSITLDGANFTEGVYYRDCGKLNTEVVFLRPVQVELCLSVTTSTAKCRVPTKTNSTVDYKLKLTYNLSGDNCTYTKYGVNAVSQDGLPRKATEVTCQVKSVTINNMQQYSVLLHHTQTYRTISTSQTYNACPITVNGSSETKYSQPSSTTPGIHSTKHVSQQAILQHITTEATLGAVVVFLGAVLVLMVVVVVVERRSKRHCALHHPSQETSNHEPTPKLNTVCEV